MPPHSRRTRAAPPGLMLLLLPLLLVASAADDSHAGNNNHSAAAAGSKQKKSSSSCPDAAECELATKQDLSAVLEALLFYLVPVEGFVVTEMTNPASPDGCDQVTVDGGNEGVSGGGCGVFFADEVPSLFAQTFCPDGYSAAIESTCAGVMRDGNRQIISFLPILGQGSSGGVAYCVVATDSVPVPAGATIEAQQQVSCSLDEGLFGGRLKKGSAAAAATKGKAALAPPKGRRMGAAAMAKVTKALAEVASASASASSAAAGKGAQQGEANSVMAAPALMARAGAAARGAAVAAPPAAAAPAAAAAAAPVAAASTAAPAAAPPAAAAPAAPAAAAAPKP